MSVQNSSTMADLYWKVQLPVKSNLTYKSNPSNKITQDLFQKQWNKETKHCPEDLFFRTV